MISSYAINTLSYNAALCTGCAMCWTVCPQQVFEPENGKARIVNYEACMECGACQLNCPTNAITVDSGVGCAAAMIRAALTGKKEASCGPSSGSCKDNLCC
ncbi:MAG: mercury methylation ferredoxin HgcB [Dehalococcoidales bacterium]|nr:mercury methylation ferredoxin HgcB [Dehalococcoidales bacterium]